MMSMASAQKEGQLFCDGEDSESYFTFLEVNKYIIWGDTYYTERQLGTKTIDNKTYVEFEQIWESGNRVAMFLRTDNGTLYQYEECCKDDTVRLPSKLKKRTTWQTADGLGIYKVMSLSGKLETPVCNYKNLLVLEAQFKDGNYTFYYLKGFGYVAATVNDKLISFVTPGHPSRKQ